MVTQSKDICSTLFTEVQSCVTCVSLPPDCSLKVKDVLKEFDADGTLARHRHGEVRGQRAVDSPSGTLLRNSIKHTSELNHRPQKGILGGNEHCN